MNPAPGPRPRFALWRTLGRSGLTTGAWTWTALAPLTNGLALLKRGIAAATDISVCVGEDPRDTALAYHRPDLARAREPGRPRVGPLRSVTRSPSNTTSRRRSAASGSFAN